MSRIARLAQSSALVLCLPATAALAELKAADVWGDWKSYSTDTGYEITATEAMSGNTLTVSNMAATVELVPDEGQGDLVVNMGTVRFVENRDGSVSVELPDTATIDVSMVDDAGDTVKFTITYNQDAPVMTATGDPAAISYDYTARSAAMIMSDLMVGDMKLGEDVAKLAVTMTDLAYVAKSAKGALRSIQQDMTVGTIDYDFDFTDPEGGGLIKFVGAMQGVSFGGRGDLPTSGNAQDLNAMLNDGFNFDGTFKTTGGNYALTFDGPDGSGTINNAAGGTEVRVSMAPNGLNYDVAQQNISMNMLLSELPLPLSFSAAETALNMLMPIQKSEEEQDFSIGVSLSGFSMSDGIWGMFDPTRQLPRDPSTAIINLSGKARVLFDFLDPVQASILEQADAAPGELNALSLDKLELDAVGTRLTGSGSLTFDNGDLVTFDGMPRPQGAIDLRLEGGNGLIDKLVGMGLLPEDQAMGTRMMLGLFARPVEGETADTLESRVEINEQGHVMANGQRLR